MRVVIADDTLLIREGVLRILEAEPGIEVVAACESRDSTLEAVQAQRPDVVLTDIRMPPSNRDEGIELARQLGKTHPEIGVIVLSQYAEPGYALSLFESGSARRGYLLKERLADRRQLVDAIQIVAAGGSYVDPKIVDTIFAAQLARVDSPLASLTEREREILALVAAGRSNSSISHELAISKRAVERHIHSIFAKLALSERADVSRRVAATLVFLAEAGDQRDPGSSLPVT